jgi:hypothetical protein
MRLHVRHTCLFCLSLCLFGLFRRRLYEPPSCVCGVGADVRMCEWASG